MFYNKRTLLLSSQRRTKIVIAFGMHAVNSMISDQITIRLFTILKNRDFIYSVPTIVCLTYFIAVKMINIEYLPTLHVNDDDILSDEL